MEKSLSLARAFNDVPLYERFALAAAAGFSHVELGVWTDLDFSRVTEELEKHGLRLSALAGADGHDLSKIDSQHGFMEYVSQSIAVAKSFGCGGLVVESNTGSAAGEMADAGDTTVAAREDLRNAAIATRVLMAVAQRAERNGVVLYLKPPKNPIARHAFLPALRLAGNVVGAVNSPALRLLLDSTALWKCRDDPDAGKVMRRIGGFLGYIHMGEWSSRGEWSEELAWLGKKVLSFHSFAGCVALHYPATERDGDILSGFLSL